MATDNQMMGMQMPSGSPGGLPVEDAYDVTRDVLRQVQPEASRMMDEALGEIMEELSTLSDAQLNEILSVLQRMYEGGEAEYANTRADLLRRGVLDEEDLPPQFDPEFVAAAIALVLEAKRDRRGQTPEPQGFARGGIAQAARRVARAGRNGDTMLAHVTPREAQMLKRRGGAGSINPRTGLPEFFLKKLFKSVGRALKKVFSNPIGRIIGTVGLTALLGPFAGALTVPIASGAATALAGGKLKDVFRSAAVSFLGGPASPLNEFLEPLTSAMGLEGMPALAQGVRSGLTATGAALLTGSKLQDAVREGMIAGVIQGGSEALSRPTVPLGEPGGPATMPTQAVLPAQTPPVQATTPAAQAPMPTQAPRPAQTAAPTGAAQTAGIPSVGASLGRMGQGVQQMAGGDLRQGMSTLGAGARDLFMPQAPDQMQIARRAGEIASEMREQGLSGAEVTKFAMDAARKELTPSMLRQYGPAIAGGLGLMSVAGGFQQEEPELTPLQKQMQDYNEAAYRRVSDRPQDYVARGAGERFGLQYDDKGNIIGSSPYGMQYQPWWMERQPQGFEDGGEVQVPNFETKVGERTIVAPPMLRPGTPLSRADAMAAVRVPSRTREDVAMGFPAQQASYWRERNQSMLMGTPFTGGLEPPRAPQYAYRLPREGEMPPPESPVYFNPRQPIGQRAYTMQGEPQEYSTMPVANGAMSAPPPGPTGSALPRRRSLFGRGSVSSSASGGFADGGIAALAQGGYPRRIGAIDGPGTETSDSIPAMLSDGEFVMTAKAVRGAGNGSRRDGAKRMYALMHRLERNAARG